MLNRSRLALAVAHADVSADIAFHSSAAYFHTGEFDHKEDVRTQEQVATPLHLTERCFVVVKGDVLADLTARAGEQNVRQPRAFP